MSASDGGGDKGSTSRFRDGLLQEGMWTESDAVGGPLSFGKYRLVGELGRGGMGIVYRAFDTELRRDVAIKLLRVHDRRDPEMASRILREARTAAPLDHPGIVPIYETGDVDGTPYYVMAFIPGRTLRDALHAEGPLPMRERARIVREAADAVAHAHLRHVVHRDLKPANLMVDPEGRVHVLDFGLAKNLEEGTQLTSTGQVLGTAPYMPPEQIDGLADQVGPASDVYSLGAVLYETLTGSPPFSGDTFTEVVARSLTREAEPPRRRDPKIPLDLETICLKALRKEPSQRYPTARELADDLARFLAGEAILARPESLREKAWRWVRRHRGVSIAAVVAAVALGVAGVERLNASRRAEEQARVERDFLQFLREISLTDLRVALDLRRAGVVGDVPKRLLDRLERAARETTRRAPELAEPHYHLGRMDRALQRFPEALAEADAALAKEPGFVPSLYERAILRVLFRRRRVAELRAEWERREGRELAEAVAQPGLGKRDLPKRPTDAELTRGDAASQRLLEGIQADLARLGREEPGEAMAEARRLGVTGAMSTCARGLFLLYGADPAAGRARLEEALRADATLEEAYEALADAEMSDGAWEKAAAVYARGLAIDRGYVPFSIGSGRAFMLRGEQALRSGEDPVPWFDKATASYARATELAPEWSEAWIGRGRAHAAWGDFLGDSGADPIPQLDAAVADLDRALSIAPASADALLARGATLGVRGEQEGERGGDPRPLYERAVADYGRALRAVGTVEGYEGRADVERWWALEAKSRGEDPTQHFQAALDDYRGALALDVRSFTAWRRRATVRLGMALYRATRGEDPLAAFPEALADLERARGLNSEHVGVWLDLGILHSTWGQTLSVRGDDPATEFRAADECLVKAGVLNPTYPAVWEQRGILESSWAEFELRAGRDATAHLDTAAERLSKAQGLAPSSYAILEAMGDLRVLRGRAVEAKGGDPRRQYEEAVGAFTEEISRNARSVGAWMGRAEARWRSAVDMAKRGEDSSVAFRSALADAEKALSIDSTWDEVWLARGRVYRARADAKGANGAVELRAAEADFSKALSINPGAVESWIARGEARLTLSAISPELRAQALSDLDRALALAPHRADAAALREAAQRR